MRRGHEVLGRFELVRINERILVAAGAMEPAEMRTLDAIHLATVQQLEDDLARIVTYDERMAAGAREHGWPTIAPA